jgi:hypothetical protein
MSMGYQLCGYFRVFLDKMAIQARRNPDEMTPQEIARERRG